jgi:translation initiation factor IF-3
MHDFLEDGHKVKVTLQFRGREMAHPELGSRLLDNVIEQLGEGVRVETQARLEGRNMTMVLSSDKKVVKKADEKPAVKPSEKPKVVAEAVPVPAAATPEVEVSVTESGEVHAENEN